ncbi:hypothetical protein CUN67_13020 [Pantoea cypripedii]|uniref:Uncharacterized protein n=1 Tax=Pantoea cypripedii TaxID=55209 RepID=A0A6B9FZU4_PANCY|nr:hypothetical protein CUN67_13020 [Pantoea cypripedii]
MAGNNVRRNFIGDDRACSRCKVSIIVTEVMVRRSSYVCNRCEVERATDWARKNREKKRASNNRYQAKNSANRSETTAKWRANHPQKKAAHQAVQTAVRNGKLTKKPCQECGSTHRIHAHHDDYSQPLDVIWLCHQHHMARHAMLRVRGQ